MNREIKWKSALSRLRIYKIIILPNIYKTELGFCKFNLQKLQKF